MAEQQRFEDLIAELDSIDKSLLDQNIKIDALRDTIEKLKFHKNNIEVVENEIDAIRAEILNPVQKELAENKKAGKFSVFGFYVGALGIIFTVAGLWYTAAWAPEKYLAEKVDETKESMKMVSAKLVTFEQALNTGLSEIEEIPKRFDFILREKSKETAERTAMISALNATLSVDSDKRSSNFGLVHYNLKKGLYHALTLDFYLERFGELLDQKRNNAIFYGAKALTMIEPEILTEEKIRVSGFFEKLYGKKGWCKTSNLYREIAYKMGHLRNLTVHLPQNLIIDGKLDCDAYNNYFQASSS